MNELLEIDKDGLVSEIVKEQTAYVLTYKVRQVVGKLNFYMPSENLDAAMKRGQKHCEIQRYRFIRVDPMFSDIDELDRKREENDLA